MLRMMMKTQTNVKEGKNFDEKSISSASDKVLVSLQSCTIKQAARSFNITSGEITTNDAEGSNEFSLLSIEGVKEKFEPVAR